MKIWPPEQPAPLLLLYNLLKHKPQIIATTAENLLTKVCPKNLLAASLIQLSKNQLIKRDELIERLVLSGYEFNTQADQIGLYAKRGSVVDVWLLPSDQPLRLEFNSNVLIEISFFNPLTKKITKKIKGVEIVPFKLESSTKTPLKSYLDESHIIFKTNDLLASDVLLNFQDTPKFSHQLERFIKELKNFKDWQIIFLTDKAKALQELFSENKLTGFDFKIIPLSQQLPEVTYGFKISDDQTIIFTDFDIFGYQILKKPASCKVDKIFIAQLKVGDYVVHLDHGIAKFSGLTKAVVDEIEREYFILNYAKSDKLYLPIDQADKIEKYLGASHPKIYSLGKASIWPQLLKKIKEDATKTAQELLNIYARRQLSNITAFQDFPEEQELKESFLYQETADQEKTLTEVMADLKSDKPADLLICGDVGFGKTEIAIRASFKAVLNNFQVAVLCPTTILAQQHEDTFKERLNKFPVNIVSLSRFQSKEKQKEIIHSLKTGQIDIVIGTHRLLSLDVKFKNLGLIIIDEEQRFGVRHKEQLKKLKAQAHVLTLTATPIPRTLHLSLSGIRDISVIETPPEGRLPIITKINPYDEQLVKNAINFELKRNGQVYYLYNDVETINLAAKKIKELISSAKIGIAHGQLMEKELANVMHDFDTKMIDILVCSTIIENGLDLPNVNTLIVHNSPKFGLAQLYQLRGRVGRGNRQAYAYFLYHSEKLPGRSGERLRALMEATELGTGFQLAIKDMEIRGVGNVLGKEQHGKISAIGLSLYQRLLEQTVEEIKTGVELEPTPDIIIDLPLEIGIPKSFEPNEQKRLTLYQKLARINSINELKQYFKKIPALPDKFNNLLKVFELKLLAQQTDIISIDSTNVRDIEDNLKSKIILIFKNQLDYQKISKLLEQQPYWQDTQNKLKIDKEKLGEDWLEKLKQAIIIFKK